MPVPANIWIYDTAGSLIPGGCMVFGREGSIEEL